MARGNQREHDRVRAQKKTTEQSKQKKGESGVSFKARQEADAAKMREKQKLAMEKKEGEQARQGQKI